MLQLLMLLSLGADADGDGAEMKPLARTPDTAG
jgi:hypothetical protein